jgi:AraC-like DNA-binding protein
LTLPPRPAPTPSIGGGDAHAPTVVALVLGAALRAQVERSLAHIGTPRFCELAAQLAPLVEGTKAAAIITEVFDAAQESVADALDALHARAPDLPLVLLVTLRPHVLREALAIAARVENTVAVVQGVDDLGAVVAASVDQAGIADIAAQIIAAVLPHLPAGLDPFFRYCALHAGRPLQVSGAVEGSRIARRTLDERLRRSGLPSAEELIGWHRILYAARELDRPGRTVESVASDLGFSSASALRNLYRRHARLTPIVARDRGGFVYVLDRFVDLLRTSRRDANGMAGRD